LNLGNRVLQLGKNADCCFVGILVGIADCEAALDVIHLGFGLLNGDARAQAGDDRELVPTALLGGRVRPFGVARHAQPEIRTSVREGELEAGRHDSDDGIEDVAQDNGFANDVAISAKLALPDIVVEHCDMASGQFFGARKTSAQFGLHAQGREKVR